MVLAGKRSLQQALISVIFVVVAVCSSKAQIGPSHSGALEIQPPGFTIVYERFPLDTLHHKLLRTEDGLIWLTRPYGLARYDGYELVHFGHPMSIPDAKYANNMGAMIEDHAGNLWIGSVQGLQKFDRKTEKLTRYLIDSTAQVSRWVNWVLSLLEDHGGELWVGTRGSGLFRFDRERGLFTQIPHIEGGRAVLSLCEDHGGTLWIGTLAGVARLDRAVGELLPLSGTNPALRKLASDTVFSLYVDRKNNLWAGSSLGLTRIDPSRTSGTRYVGQAGASHTGPVARITAIVEDPEGGLWVGTHGKGLFRYDPGTDGFLHFPQSPDERDTTAGDDIVNLFVDRISATGQLRSWVWILYGRPIGRLALQYNPFTQIEGFSHRRVSWILVTRPAQDGTLWLGTTREGLFKLDLISKRYVQYFAGMTVGRIVETRGGTLYVQVGPHLMYVYDQTTASFSRVCEDTLALCGETRDGSLWFHTWGPRVHLAKYDPSSGGFQHYPRTDPDSGIFVDEYAFPLHEDRDGILWFGTFGGGLSRFDPRTGQYRRYTSGAGGEGTLRNNSVKAVVEDEAGTLWIATDGGLHSFDRASEQFTCHLLRLSGRDLAIKGLVADGAGNLWLACSHRLACFVKATGRFLVFGGKQGLRGLHCQSIAFNKEDGRIYVGQWKRAFSFNPDSVLALHQFVSPKVALTGFDIFDKPAQLPTTISMIREIVLPYSDNFFSFKFAVLDFVDPTLNRYAYKLEGFDREWQYPFDRRVAYYTNVDPGEYTFRVKGSNSRGVWNDEGASVRLVVTPPWWRTIWAYCGYGVALLLVLYGMHRYDRKRVRLKHDLELKEFEAEKLREIDGMKMRFFANISHEFRTPLTLILGPAEKLLSRAVSEGGRDELHIIRRNGLRLLELINQLLDISKLDTGTMKNRVQALDLIPYLKGIVFSFASLAERKHITLKFESPEASITAYVDRDKLQKIVTNLLSNAFKFTPDGGEVCVGVSVVEGEARGGPEQIHPEMTKEFAEIVVTDTGVGIPMDRLEKIFHRFYQVDDSHVREHEGTGIGLALTKELVEAHHGHISVTSEPGKGSTFRIRLPMGKEHWKEGEIIEETEYPEGESIAAPLHEQVEDAGAENLEEVREREPDEGEGVQEESAGVLRSLVLVVEDNADVRGYIRAFLSPEYRIEEAEDGQAGLEAALDLLPDLVVSDIMMPKMDGVELCRRLKTDERTSHIPVILLTARAAEEGKLEGLETGADDYIIKPFDMRELQARTRNLIELRKTLQEKYRRRCVLEPAAVPIDSMEERFLRKALDLVQEQMAEPGFSTESLARGLCMSRRQLYRKLQALTGRSAHEFIRNLRLQRAAKLLEAHWGNVAEVAFEVGFSSLSHFAKAFRQEYGVLPSEYRPRHTQK